MFFMFHPSLGISCLFLSSLVIIMLSLNSCLINASLNLRLLSNFLFKETVMLMDCIAFLNNHWNSSAIPVHIRVCLYQLLFIAMLFLILLHMTMLNVTLEFFLTIG